MQNKKSKLIVIDGLDGSGKSTQFALVQDNLTKNNIKYRAISFPDYDKPSSTLVKMYLNGEFSNNADEINAYAASSFYAVDRYASFKLYWEDYYNSDGLILASRYVSSNAIHQMVKLPKKSWDDYLHWLEDYEYNKLGLPKPDRTIFLDMPVEVSQKLLDNRYNGDISKKDIHESNIEYLRRCRETALYAADKLGWIVLECNSDNLPIAIEIINEKLMKMINGVIK
ncbi:MAG: deoxynucleoside kinase [Clostridiales bacterium]|nr:deoxynucleoside kinase [Clostridiales bacterium]